MSLITKPLLAVQVEDIENLQYPQYVSPKYDGIRCLIIDGKAVSRNFKPQPNRYIRKYLEDVLPDGLDGELVLKDPTPVLGSSLEESNGVVRVNFNDIQSQIMSFEGEPNFEYHIFDYVKDDLNKPYLERMKDLKEWYKTFSKDPSYKDKFKLVLPVKVNNQEELFEYEEECLEAGYEGVMLRKDLRYKLGRSTNREGILLKLKRFIDAESTVIGFEERMHNGNVKEQDAFGRAKRSSHQENLVGMDTLGALVVQNELGTFRIGTGFNDELRKEIWINKEKYLGKLVTYKSQPSGAKDLPRFPVYKSIRLPADLD